MIPLGVTNEENLRNRLEAIEVDIERFAMDATSPNKVAAHTAELYLKAARYQRDLIRAILSPRTT